MFVERHGVCVSGEKRWLPKCIIHFNSKTRIKPLISNEGVRLVFSGLDNLMTVVCAGLIRSVLKDSAVVCGLT